MVPRVHVTFASIDNTYDELIDIFRENKFTRLPVCEDSQDNIVGIINMKDLLLYDRSENFQIRDILRELQEHLGSARGNASVHFQYRHRP